uniref:U6 small nuclear RNA (adenine-(43)-N(6))-methyltransferase n=1 Tax=Timema monikensis TaxID=170555 RepID=A0A7R9E628_9NEOP|nr:unnamed protein product [Timema monikensis]
MAIQYPQFRKFAHQGLSGKMTINFKDTAALHALSTTLLEKDFNLKVNIPTDRLVPTIPSRLNYILLIEDLLECGGRREGDVHGIDIGTGASCVYSLLAAKTKQWKMLATEVDKESVKFAIDNVQRNNLQHLILVKSVSHTVVLKGALEEDHSYDFCMCNPPFFSAESELNPSVKRRSPNRPPPRNGLTGSLQEVLVMGGEVAFIKRMIEESLELKTTIKIYSSLVGHKSSLTPLKNALKQAGVSNMTEHINSVSEDSMGISVPCPSIENTNNSASIGSGPCIRRGQKRQGGGAITMAYKLFKSSDATSCTGILLKAGVALVPVHLDICIELMLLGGSGGQESLHQLLQYFKNNIKR